MTGAPGDGSTRTRELEHEVLIARDEAIGLRAEVAQLTRRLDELATTPLGSAMSRIDALEGERQALYDYVTAVRAETENSLRHQAETLRASRTWQVGRAALAPLRAASRLRRR